MSYNHICSYYSRKIWSNQPTPKGWRKTHFIRLHISGNWVSFRPSFFNTSCELNLYFKSKSLELTIWFIPSLIANAIAISFIGVLFGPMFPIAMNYASRILPRRSLTGSIGWIVGFGSAGSAAIPFITGVISSKKGIQSLQPL